MHKTFYLACILGCAIAEAEPEITVKEGASLGTATSGDDSAGGMLYEIQAKGKEEDNEIVMIALSLGWETSNEKAPFENGSWIQNWAQWEDDETPGTWWAVTCNVQFDNTVEVSKQANVTVRGLKGTSIDAATVTTGGPLAIGTPTEEWGPTA